MLRERDGAELAGRVREREPARLDVLDLGVVGARAEDLPQPHACSGPGVDLLSGAVAALVDDHGDARELPGERPLGVEDGVIDLSVGGRPEVGEPRLDIAPLDDVQDVAQVLCLAFRSLPTRSAAPSKAPFAAPEAGL